jgi:CIC family chloride channel protein
MTPVGTAVPEHTRIADLVPMLQDAFHGQLPIVSPAGAYQGVVTARTVAEMLSQQGGAARQAGVLAEWPTDVSSGQPLDEALQALETSGAPAVPVLDDGRIVGWLDAEALLPVLQDLRLSAVAK